MIFLLVNPEQHHNYSENSRAKCGTPVAKNLRVATGLLAAS